MKNSGTTPSLGNKKRRFAPARLHQRSANPRAGGPIPSGLSNPVGALGGPGVTIWKFITPPTALSRGLGPIVTTARLVPLFWGDFWRTATDPSVADVHQAIEQLLLSPYLSEVSQYGFQSLTLDPPLIVVTPGPRFPTYSGDSVRDMVWDLIDDDRFPEPDEDGGQIVYMVFAPQGTVYDVGADVAAGAHSDAKQYTFPLDWDHAWVGWCNHDTLDGITEIFTHELVEILTDPQPYGGFTVTGLPDLDNEIVDSCFNQTGLVEGHRVSAYYSDRLKACVVPTRPHKYALSLGVQLENVAGPPLAPILSGHTEAIKTPICFNGAYKWKLYGEEQRVTVTASAVGYLDPVFNWTVTGVGVSNSSTLDDKNALLVHAPANRALDPLAVLTNLPPETANAKAFASGNLCVVESVFGQLPADFDVVCTVTENGLPSGYNTGRTESAVASCTGTRREMDERFQEDLRNCLNLQRQLARDVQLAVVIPHIGEGYPSPVWVERSQPGVETETQRQVNETYALASFIKGADRGLSDTLGLLADGVNAVALARRE
jgi:hypothetical protein